MTPKPQRSDNSDSAKPSVVEIESPTLALKRTTIDDYCHAVRRARHNEFWWYYNGLTQRFRRQKPFQDAAGRWWWMVKPYFAWPVDFFSPISNSAHARPRRMLLGWQFPTNEAAANSVVRQNVIFELSGYGLDRIESNKRRAIRRALRELRYEIVRPDDSTLAEEARIVWNSHVERTGWNRSMDNVEFMRSWAELAEMPGTSVIVAREIDGQNPMCAWLITRILGDTIYIDTIASHTDRVGGRPNDGLIFLALQSASHAGVVHAHYSLVSRITSLEAFKRSLGFIPHPFPCHLHLLSPIGALMRWIRPGLYSRLRGDESWHRDFAGR